MGDVLAFHGSAALLWTTTDDASVPVRSVEHLETLVSAFYAYGHTARLHGRAGDGRESIVTSLGGDGWIVNAREAGIVRRGWPRSSTVTRQLDDGSVPTALTGSQWYLPDPTSDVAGCVAFAEQIQSSPAVVAELAWAWSNDGTMVSGYATGRPGYDRVVCDTVADALALIAESAYGPWPTDAAQAALAYTAALDINRVILTSPGQVTVRERGTMQRIRLLRRGKGEDSRVEVIGLVDELGHEYSIRLPDRELVRIMRTRAVR